MIMGALLAYGSRSAYARYNESQSIALSLYNVLLSSALVLMIELTSNSSIETTFIISSAVIIFSDCSVIAILFIPKVLAVFKDKGKKQSTTMAPETSKIDENIGYGTLKNAYEIKLINATVLSDKDSKVIEIKTNSGTICLQPEKFEQFLGMLTAVLATAGDGSIIKDSNLSGRKSIIERFENPFNIWCLHCDTHIGQGVRFNSEKTKVGYYFSTPIWHFKFHCPTCLGWLEMESDPKNAVYVCKSGCRKKIETWEREDSEAIELTSNKFYFAEIDLEESKKLNENAFYRLEHQVEDERKAEQAAPVILELQNKKSQWRDDYSISKMLRSNLRSQKKDEKAKQADEESFRNRTGLNCPIAKETPRDVQLAKRNLYGHQRGKTFDIV
ncbi:DUF572-domain-containing protein [Rozella allomycis CSF55]|uniref:CWC16 protein domain-containing protein n=1 Tax=Rozella allomycis (strain CSF55) TaxID=988480 RepID=A0A075AWE7_ROZAC|nr:CWC16 protein domain-containing protein [Rozella allomycis CSF55]RKP21010.1 DUF572-domain-containing protein [Rozella allomycis CSF55]|eukprot:EPZ33032.1 CWC16 protein domain-containing protein [Rozella allomycis CSF55]